MIDDSVRGMERDRIQQQRDRKRKNDITAAMNVWFWIVTVSIVTLGISQWVYLIRKVMGYDPW